MMRKLLLSLLLWCPLLSFAAAPTVRSVSTDEDSTNPVNLAGLVEPTACAQGDIIYVIAQIDQTGGTWTDDDLTAIDSTQEHQGNSIYLGYVVRGASAPDITISHSGEGSGSSMRGAAICITDTDDDFTGDGLDVVYAAGSHYLESTDDGCDGSSPDITTNNNDAIVGVFAVCFGNGSNTMTEPSGYTEQVDDAGSDGTVHIATIAKATAGLENPGAWTGSAGGSADGAYYTLAIGDVTASDVTAPTCSVAPVEHSDTTTSVTVDATCADETDSTVDHYWGVLANDSTDPTATELKDNTYSGGFIDRDPQTGISNGVENQVTLTGLSASTAYDVFHTVCDSSGNCKTVVQVDITTDAASLSCSADDASPVPTTTVRFTCSGGGGGNLTQVTTLDGDVITAEAGATPTIMDVIIPAVSNYVAGGSMVNTEWDVAGNWVVTNGTDNANVSMEIDPPDTSHFGQVCTPLADDGSNVFPDPPAVDADDYFNSVESGSGVTTLCNGSTSADSAGWSGTAYLYDDGATAWVTPNVYSFGPSDTDAPLFGSASIADTTLTVGYNETMQVGAGGNGGTALTCTGGAVTPTFDTLVGSVITYSLSRSVDPSETCTIDYTQPGDGLEDLYANDLATYSGNAVATAGCYTDAVFKSALEVVRSVVNTPMCN